MNSLYMWLSHNVEIDLFLLYVLVMVSLWLAEKAMFPETAGAKLKHSSINSLFILSALPIQLCMTVVCLVLANWTALHHWGLVYLLPDAGNPLIKYGLMFIALDFLDYVYHVAMHFVPSFWRFHRVHHSDLAVDVSTTVREHPGETVIRNGFMILWALLCGASAEILVVRQAAETVVNIAAHTSLRLPRRWARPLGWLFITPNLHHVHHHFEMPSTNRNFGDVFSIWDRLFGTYSERAHDDTIFGLDTHMDGRIDKRLFNAVTRMTSFLPYTFRA